MLDVSTRLLRYFVTVAEELHFTQAAERLYVAQPALSKAIRRLEHQLGFPLFVRGRHGVALTASGSALLPTAYTVLSGLDAGLRTARAAHRAATHVLVIGYHSSVDPDLLGSIIDRFHTLRPGWRVELRAGDWTDPAGAVLHGLVDAALLHLPVSGQEALATETLTRDRIWVALPTDHRLTARSTVVLADLADEPFIALPASSGPHREFWLARHHFATPPRIGAEVTNSDDWFAAITTGRGIALISEASTRIHQRPGITYRPVNDATHSDLAIAWPTTSTDKPLRDLVTAARHTTTPDNHHHAPQPPTRPPNHDANE